MMDSKLPLDERKRSPSRWMRAGWPDWENFRLFGGYFLRAGQHLGDFFTNSSGHPGCGPRPRAVMVHIHALTCCKTCDTKHRIDPSYVLCRTTSESVAQYKKNTTYLLYDRR
jgi:hypothetical protein